ncbi:MAG: flagellar basal body L-ring protein FlgH [Betaproteobacteria bacterium]|nr:flagellar basal body L-ring protein FlgH [Betaproteobacteria bacterium]
MNLRSAFAATIIAAVVLVSGCATNEPVLAPSPAFAPTMPVADPPRMATGSIYAGGIDDWFGRKRQYRVGDVLTVILQERTAASRSALTKSSRAAEISAKAPTTGGLLSNLNLGGESTLKSEGTGRADQTAELTGAISVTISEVLPNGNLVIRGEKQLALSEGSEFVQVAGIVRPEDIAPDGSVQSRRLANAQIAYRGTGELANASKGGWGTQLLHRLWPF